MSIQPCKISVCSILLLFFLINYPSSTFGSIFSDGRHIRKGRDALLDGNPKAALPNFEAIAQSNPNYINCAQDLCIGIWTYLGRTYHELGNNQKALESLKKGKGRHWQDRFNKIYLGLVMAQTGQTKEGTAELDAGLKALGAWLSSFAGRGTTGQYWDPDGELQKAIADTSNLLQGDKINWDKVTKGVHWLGVNFEQEVRDVHRDKQYDTDGGDD
jgi:tetratricopeptide (TPR) repeat protein